MGVVTDGWKAFKAAMGMTPNLTEEDKAQLNATPVEVIKEQAQEEERARLATITQAQAAETERLKAETLRLQQEAAAAKQMAEQNARQAQEATAAAQLEAATNTIERMRAEFRLTPAEAEKYLALAASNPEAFKASLPILKEREPIAALAGAKGVSAARISQEMQAQAQDAGKKLADRANQIFAENKGNLPIQDCYKRANAENKTLAVAYLQANSQAAIAEA